MVCRSRGNHVPLPVKRGVFGVGSALQVCTALLTCIAVLQCTYTCIAVLQCVYTCMKVLQCTYTCIAVLQCTYTCIAVLQCMYTCIHTSYCSCLWLLVCFTYSIQLCMYVHTYIHTYLMPVNLCLSLTHHMQDEKLTGYWQQLSLNECRIQVIYENKKKISGFSLHFPSGRDFVFSSEYNDEVSTCTICVLVYPVCVCVCVRARVCVCVRARACVCVCVQPYQIN